MSNPPIISYATESGDQLSIVHLDDGGVDIHVPPQGWLWFTRGRWYPLIGMTIIAAIFAGVWVFLSLQWLRGDRDVIIAFPVAVIQAAFVAFFVVQTRAKAKMRVRIRATRKGLWAWTTGAAAPPSERFFPIEQIGDVNVKWTPAHGGPRGSMIATLRGGNSETFLDHCRGKDIVEIVNHVRRALGMWPRSHAVPKGA